MVDKWQGVEDLDLIIAGDPSFVVGWRATGGHIQIAQVNIHQNTFDSLRSIAREAIEDLLSSEAREYDPAAELEVGEEYFSIRLQDLVPPQPEPEQPSPSGGISFRILPLPAVSGTADLLEALSDVENLSSLDASRLSSGRFLFYAVIVGSGTGRIAFLRKIDPTLVARRGFAAFSFADTLKKVVKPDMLIEEDVDVVITSDHAYVLKKAAFEFIVSDLRIELENIGGNVQSVATALTTSIPLSKAAISAIEAACSRRVSMAVRLRGLAARVISADLSPVKVREAMIRHGEDPSTLISEADEFVFDEALVPSFLDVVEGRWFEDDFTGEKRRADRLSRR